MSAIAGHLKIIPAFSYLYSQGSNALCACPGLPRTTRRIRRSEVHHPGLFNQDRHDSATSTMQGVRMNDFSLVVRQGNFLHQAIKTKPTLHSIITMPYMQATTTLNKVHTDAPPTSMSEIKENECQSPNSLSHFRRRCCLIVIIIS
jgi:hypothetical protein